MDKERTQFFIDLAIDDYQGIESYVEKNPDILLYQDEETGNNLLSLCRSENTARFLLSLEPSLLTLFNKDDLTMPMLALLDNKLLFLEMYISFDPSILNQTNSKNISLVDLLIERNTSLALKILHKYDFDIKSRYLILSLNNLSLLKLLIDKLDDIEVINSTFFNLLLENSEIKHNQHLLELLYHKFPSLFIDQQVIEKIVTMNNFDFFNFLVDQQNQVYFFSIKEKNLLFYLIDKRQTLIVKKLINLLSTEQLNEISDDGETIFDYILSNLNLSLIDFLVTKNIKINKWQSLIVFLQIGRLELLKKYLSFFDKNNCELIKNLYLSAIRTGKIENIDFLFNDLKLGVPRKIQNILIDTLVDKYISQNSKLYEPVLLYLKKIFEINLSNINPETDRFYFFDAIIDGNLELIEDLFTPSLLLLTDEDGNNALFHAVVSKNVKIVSYLLSKKIDINKSRKSPVIQAIIDENLEIINILLINGADLGSTSDSNAPINYATEDFKKKITNLLIDLKSCNNREDPITLEEITPNLSLSIAWNYEDISVMCYEIIPLQNYLRIQKSQTFESMTNQDDTISVIILPFDRMILASDSSIFADYHRRFSARVIDFVQYADSLVPVFHLSKL